MSATPGLPVPAATPLRPAQDESVIYEVSLLPDAEIVEEFDAWLGHHVGEMLALPGFLDARIRHTEAEDGSVGERVVQYHLESRQALADYLAQHAERMRGDGVARFGGQFTASRRILDHGFEIRAPAEVPNTCTNCEEQLTGQYCARCGQRARRRMITLWELLKDASELLTSLDSRLWKSLRYLLFRPGLLTREYLDGRRVRYVAPLRLFIATSLIFFFVVQITTAIDVNGDEESGSFSIQMDTGDTHDPAPPAGDGDTADSPATEASPEPPAAAGETGRAVVVRDDCADFTVKDDLPFLQGWLSDRQGQALCRKLARDEEGFERALLENIPAMMFFFLPFMALVMRLLYLLTGRFYVEHLLFLVHYHSFFFLLVTLTVIFWQITGASDWPEWPVGLFTAAVVTYIPIYLYKALRRVYLQGHLLTLVKYFTLGLAYFVSLVITLAGTALITKLTI